MASFIITFSPAAPFASSGASSSVLNDPSRVITVGNVLKDTVCLAPAQIFVSSPGSDFDLCDDSYYTPEVQKQFDDFEFLAAGDDSSPSPTPESTPFVASPQSPDQLDLLQALDSFEGLEDVNMLAASAGMTELNVLTVEETEKHLAALNNMPLVEEIPQQQQQQQQQVLLMTQEEFNASSFHKTMAPVPVDVLSQVVSACDLPIEIDIDDVLFGQDSQGFSVQASPYSAVSSVAADSISDDSASSVGSPDVGRAGQKRGRKRSNVDPEGRKIKKREQNREAANRYRLKKREEEKINMVTLKKLLDQNKKFKKQLKQVEALLQGAKMMARASLC